MSPLTPGPSPAHPPLPSASPRERGGLVARRRRLPRASGKLMEAARDLRKEPTRSEATLWNAIRGRQLGHKFRRQHPVGRFVIDFYRAEQRLAVEVDGGVHEDLRQADAEREALLNTGGIRVIRVPSGLVEADLQAALILIKQAFTRHPSPAVGRGRG